MDVYRLFNYILELCGDDTADMQQKLYTLQDILDDYISNENENKK